MLAKTICLFVIFAIINIYSNDEVIESFLDNVCLTSPSLNVSAMNDRLITCRKSRTEVPIANTEKKMRILCEHLDNDILCFKQSVQYWSSSKCIKPGKENIFTLMIKVFEAGREFKCKSHRALYRNFLTSNGQNCLNTKGAAVNDCTNSIQFVEPWVTLETIYLRTADPYSRSECWQKGLWAYCVNNELNDCSDKTALQFFRGYYGSMLVASPCKQLITKEFPALQQSAAATSSSVIWLINFFLAFLCFIIIILISV